LESLMHVDSSPQPEPHRNVRILYAEDVRELRELARIVFSRDGHTVECVEDGTYAAQRVEADPNRYDLIVTDHHMPRMNGLDLVLQLRRLSYKGKIMVFSSEVDPTIATEYRKLGVDRILFKPVYPSFLRQAIAEMFPSPAPVAAGDART
jgi:two-component system, chemotaxis family, chemotaxis protein CheY